MWRRGCDGCVQTPLSGVVIDDALTHTYEAEGHDMHTLLFAFLDELLFVFSTELFVPRCALPSPELLSVECAGSLDLTTPPASGNRRGCRLR